ncbi:hypothetical protein Tco_1551625 [Tanacetum coccineum]
MTPRVVLLKTGLTPFNTVRLVNTAHPKPAGKPLMDDKGFIDSRCSRHMTGNIAYLLDFKKLDRGYVTFGGGEHGGRIFSKGTLKTVGDEAVHKELGDRMEMATTTASSLEADQESGNINKTQSMATLNGSSP